MIKQRSDSFAIVPCIHWSLIEKEKETMTKNGKRVPEGHRTVTPHLTVGGAAQAIEFYQKAFGAKELGRAPGPDGKLMHAEIQIGDSRVFLNDEFPEMGARSPLALNGTPVQIHLYVEDADALFQQAVEAGGTGFLPLARHVWGGRFGIVTGPFGHRRSVASRIPWLPCEE